MQQGTEFSESTLPMPDFLARYGTGLVEAISKTYPPKVTFGASEALDFSKLSRQPLGLQGDAIAALVRSIKDTKGTLLVGEMGTGKCVAPETLVSTNGEVLTAEEIWERYSRNPGFDGEGYVAEPSIPLTVPSLWEAMGKIVQQPVVKLYRQQISAPLKRITLADGRSIRVTQIHPLLTQRGWTNDVQVGDHVAVPRCEGLFVQSDEPDVARFMAWLVAEGNERSAKGYNSQSAIITQKDRSVLDSLLPIAHTMGLTTPGVHCDPRGMYYLRFGATQAQPLFEQLGHIWGKRSAAKRIPRFVMQGNLETVRAFLRAFISAEGSVSTPKQSLVEITTASFRLAHELLTLIRRVGIYARVRGKMGCATNGLRIMRQYYRIVIGGDDARKLAADMGLESPSKQQQLEQIAKRPGNNNINTVYVADLMARAKAITGLSRKASNNLFVNVRMTGKQPTVNRFTVERLVGLLEADGKPEALEVARTVRDRIQSDVFFVPVVAVEQEPYEGWVYDLEVADTHNFVANHLIVHNTFLSATAAHFSGSKRTLVLCPPHLVEKWVREVRITIPGVHAQAIDSMTEVDRLPYLPKGFYILSREKAKLGPIWKAVVHWKVRKTEEGPVQLPYCPNCGQLVLINEVVPTSDDLHRRKHYCPHCNSPLWTVDHTGPHRYPLADYIKRRLPKNFFDLLVIDECHEMKGSTSSQGISAGLLAEHCRKTLAATGTLFGGYASTLFHLLWRFSPEIRQDFKHTEEARFVELYGLLERTYKEGDPEDARSSRGKRRKVSTREKPGISPLLLPHLLPNVVFVRLPDVAEALPSYKEEVHKFAMTEEQAEVHAELKGQLERKLQEMLRKGSKRLLGAYLQSLLHQPDTPWREEVVTTLNPDTGETEAVAYAPPLSHEVLYPKEQALLDLIRQERSQGRRVWVYVQGVESRDVTARLKGFLTKAGLKVEILRSDTVDSRRREEWVKRTVNRGVDVVISHPKLVQTGLDLLDFPTLVFYQVEYSVYTLRQAARRSWRIGQQRGVKVIHMVYTGTLQERAVRLIAAKAKSSLALEGELGDSGLTQQAEDDLLVSLAKSLVEGEAQADWQDHRVDDFEQTSDLSGMGSEQFLGTQPILRPRPVKAKPSAEPQIEVLVHYLEEDLVISAGRRKKVVSANQGMLFPI